MSWSVGSAIRSVGHMGGEVFRGLTNAVVVGPTQSIIESLGNFVNGTITASGAAFKQGTTNLVLPLSIAAAIIAFAFLARGSGSPAPTQPSTQETTNAGQTQSTDAG